MAIIIYGEAEASIGLSEFHVYCPACESHQWADAMVMSTYCHFYYIPLLPTGKHVNLICQNCGLKRYGASFSPKIISNFDEIKSKFRYPLISYIVGTSLLVLITIGIIVGLLQ